MDEKTKELIAIGASITAHCQSCLEYHIKEATNLGASAKDIHMAIAIGKSLEKGASKVMDNFIKEKLGTDIVPQSDICCVSDSAHCSK